MKISKFKLSTVTNTIVSFSAIVIALASIFISTWQGMEIRKHNRLSVRPKLDIVFNVKKQGFGYIILNSGLGPANIIEMKIFLDGNEFIPPKQYFNWYEPLRDTLELIDMKVSSYPVTRGVTISAGQAWTIIEFSENDNKNLTIDPSVIYQRLYFKITYESIYGESFACQIPE